MPKTRWIAALAVLLLWLSGRNLPAAPATVAEPGAPYLIDAWDSEDGLPGNTVTAITQTSDGYLWLGTLWGLVRLASAPEGIRFTVFDESNTPGLESSRIVSLFSDAEGNLWIGTESAGVAVLRNGVVQGTEVRGRLASACQDALGAVWLYTADGQLSRYWQGQHHAFVVDRAQSSSCRSVIAERGGPVWLGTDTALYALASRPDPGSIEPPIEQSLPVTNLDFLLASERGGYWRLADRRIQKWTTNHLDRDWGPYPWPNVRVSAACEDREGNLVVGTRGAGLYWFDAEGQATGLSTNNGLSYNYVYSLHRDREGTLWVGTDGGGLNRVKRQVFNVLPETRGWVVQSVCEDDSGGLWIGSNGHGVDYWKHGFLENRSLGLFSRFVRAVFVDRDQQAWAGAYLALGSGLFRWEDDRFLPVSAPAIHPVVSAIHQDRQGRLWLGTKGGLVRRDERDWKLFTTREGLSSDAVQAIADDADGNLWIGTAGGGLNRLRDGQFTAFRKTDKDGLPSDDISALWLDQDGVLWIGTYGSGLARFHLGRWSRFTTRDGLISNSVGYLIEDADGYLWIGSNRGLMRVRKQTLNDFARGAIRSILGRAYQKPDGLPTGECTLGSQPAACRARDGTLWFPTIKGLVSVNPARLNSNTNPPPVVIESVFIEGEPQDTNALRAAPQSVIVPAGKERVEIRYTSLNLAAPDRARFKYQLEGHESGWFDAGSVRVAHYSKLPAGDYRFHVTACNEDGIWNETGSTVALTVVPPIWQTWWFRTVMAVALLGAIVAVVHYVSTQRLKRQVERLRHQEALEKERARIARDIHDQVGASLTQVSLLGELVETDKDSPADVEAHARQISQTARETTRALDEIVWTVNPSNDTLEGLINYVCKYAQDYLAVAGLRYRLDVPSELPAAVIPPELRHNVFLAAKEAVTNVVRHAQASAAWVRLKLEPGKFTLEIEDDGRGPAGTETKAAEARSGLRNMRSRMEDLGGTFTIGRGAEGGTLVRLTAPLRTV